MKSNSYPVRHALMFFALLYSSFLFSQWTSNGPYGGTCRSLIKHGSSIFAGTNNGVFRSDDNGTNWNFTSNKLEMQHIYDLLSVGSELFATTNGAGVFVSSDMGANWSPRNNGLGDVFAFSLFKSSAGMFVGTSSGVFFSSNNGGQWISANTGISGGLVARSWAQMGDTVFAGTYGGGLYRSSNNGQSWTQVANGFPSGFPSTYVYALYTNGDTILAGTSGGLSRSVNRGVSWSAYGSGIPQGNHLFSIVRIAGSLVASSPAVGIYVSQNGGATWAVSNTGIQEWDTPTTMPAYEWINELFVNNGVVLAASDEGMYRSSDNGASWSYSDEGITAQYIGGLGVTSGVVLAGTPASGVYRTSNKGQSWQRTNSGLPAATVRQVAANSTYAFAALYNFNVYRSSDQGANWTSASNGLPNGAFAMVATDARIAALVPAPPPASERLYHSLDNGMTWSQLPATHPGMSALELRGQRIYVGTKNGMLLYSDNEGQAWNDISGYLPDVQVTTILALDTVVYVGTAGMGIYRVTNNGANMYYSGEGLASNWISDIDLAEGILFCSTFGGGVNASTNGGNSWFKVDDGMMEDNATCLAHDDDHLYAGTQSRVYQAGEEDDFFDNVRILAGLDKFSGSPANGIYPNPSTGMLKLSTSGEVNVTIFNNTGQLVFSSCVTGNGSIDLSDLPRGLYFVEVNDGSTLHSYKIVLTE
jgi:photosystem II stability/assembly factor-like uncharacterized protein